MRHAGAAVRRPAGLGGQPFRLPEIHHGLRRLHGYDGGTALIGPLVPSTAFGSFAVLTRRAGSRRPSQVRRLTSHPRNPRNRRSKIFLFSMTGFSRGSCSTSVGAHCAKKDVDGGRRSFAWGASPTSFIWK